MTVRLLSQRAEFVRNDSLMLTNLNSTTTGTTTTTSQSCGNASGFGTLPNGSASKGAIGGCDASGVSGSGQRNHQNQKQSFVDFSGQNTKASNGPKGLTCGFENNSNNNDDNNNNDNNNNNNNRDQNEMNQSDKLNSFGPKNGSQNNGVLNGSLKLSPNSMQQKTNFTGDQDQLADRKSEADGRLQAPLAAGGCVSFTSATAATSFVVGPNCENEEVNGGERKFFKGNAKDNSDISPLLLDGTQVHEIGGRLLDGKLNEVTSFIDDDDDDDIDDIEDKDLDSRLKFSEQTKQELKPYGYDNKQADGGSNFYNRNQNQRQSQDSKQREVGVAVREQSNQAKVSSFMGFTRIGAERGANNRAPRGQNLFKLQEEKQQAEDGARVEDNIDDVHDDHNDTRNKDIDGGNNKRYSRLVDGFTTSVLPTAAAATLGASTACPNLTRPTTTATSIANSEIKHISKIVAAATTRHHESICRRCVSQARKSSQPTTNRQRETTTISSDGKSICNDCQRAKGYRQQASGGGGGCYRCSDCTGSRRSGSGCCGGCDNNRTNSRTTIMATSSNSKQTACHTCNIIDSPLKLCGSGAIEGCAFGFGSGSVCGATAVSTPTRISDANEMIDSNNNNNNNNNLDSNRCNAYSSDSESRRGDTSAASDRSGRGEVNCCHKETEKMDKNHHHHETTSAIAFIDG